MPSFGNHVFPVQEASEEAESELINPEQERFDKGANLQVYGQFNSTQNYYEETKSQDYDANYFHSLPTPVGGYSTDNTELHQIEEEKTEDLPQQRQHGPTYVSPFEKFIAE